MAEASETTMRDKLIELADLYCLKKKRARATISTVVFGNGNILDRMARGEADVVTATFERAVKFFDANWPDDVPWPEGLQRPSLVAAAANTEAA
jgi:hypothetical protein